MRRAFFISCVCAAGLLAGVLTLSAWMDWAAQQDIHENMAETPRTSVAVVLGTARWLAKGQENSYFRHRIEAAVELYRSQKVSKILVSGDNSHHAYNEPRDMYMALVEMGVSPEDIVMDFAGFRTFDSMVRAQEVFGLTNFIVVSQRFHLARALYIARSKGILAQGFLAEDPGSIRFTRVRELGARVKAFLDCQVLGTKPHFLGEPIPIAVDQAPDTEIPGRPVPYVNDEAEHFS